jgi:hypothetical protein
VGPKSEKWEILNLDSRSSIPRTEYSVLDRWVNMNATVARNTKTEHEHSYRL